ncbi:MAG: PAS domain S-box protein [Hahellaceae bacterium]|nr:PAS domain S-box protein [Hahellaceae bacterium]MCP5210264.1 PAS domain S-box protein [Hahellaceae bacterium]
MRLSFRWKTVLGIALIEAVFLFVLIVNSLSILRQSHSEQIEQRAATLARLFAAATTDAVLSTDLATLESMIAELASNREVLYVRVYGNSGLLAESVGMSTPQQVPDQNAGLVSYTIKESIRVDKEVYGSVELALDTSDVNAVWNTARRESINIALLEVLLVAIASLVLGNYLTRHLGRLRNGIESIQKGNFELIESDQSQDEIGETIHAFNSLSLELKSSHQMNLTAIQQTRELANRLSRKEQWLRAVIDNIADGIITLDERGIIRSANVPAQKILGYRNEELKGLSYDLIILDERQRERVSRFIQTSRKDSGNFATAQHHNEIGYRRDGLPFSMDLTLSFARFEDQDVFIMLVRDLTWQRQVEQQALISETIKSGMLEASLSAVIAIDEHDNIIEFNPAAEKIFGHSKEDVMGKEMAGIILPERFRKAHSVGMQKYLKTGIGPVLRQRIQLAALRKNGEEFPVELAITPINVGDSTVFTAVLDDITERLEGTQRLEEAKESADKANLAKSRFLASMSHEIRTPLNVILGMVELMQGTGLNAQQRRLIQSAENAGRNLLEVINDVLDLSKIEAGKMKAHPVRFSPARIIEETAELFQQRVWSKKLGIHVVITREVPSSIYADVTFFKQIAINLVSNAIKFTETGGLLLKLQVETVRNESVLLLEVQDTGKGISKEKQSQIFEEFTQLHTVSDGTTGTGLGLVICQQLSQLMQGELSFRSAEEKGSCFSLRLPLPATYLPVAEYPYSANHCIVLYSTDELWRKHYAEQLGSWGIKVFTCYSAREFFKVLELQAEQVDVLLFDYAVIKEELNPILDKVNEVYPGKFGILLSRRNTAEPLQCKSQINGVLDEPSRRFRLATSLLAALHHTPWRGLPLQIETTGGKQSAAQSLTGRILLVEDSEANRIIAEAFLAQVGYEVVKAVDGLEAIKILRKSRFDLVLMDMRMPNLGGLEATKIIRDEKLAIDTPIIALTAHALTQEKEACLTAGMQDFLTKPIDKTVLLKTVNHWLSCGYGQDGDATVHPSGEISSPDKSDTAINIGIDIIDRAALIQEKSIEQLIEDTSDAAARRMLNIFDTEARKRVLAIAECIKKSDYEQVETSVHALKSSAQTFGAYRLHLLAKEAESCCRAGRFDEAFRYCDRLETLVNESLDELEKQFGYRS